ncbi:SusC/RagA family TonB-linked outer membrane protein [Fulvivirgaceae bacterium PWU5]|uniref:SusC/RagA family TonB-linked outer membrane protein n=1 Tax=Dawidia cretensis TaxID=2782350 RepID=A0AAP2GSM8_9BACT|nr:SusC/RagA family TonB-linked outer membrane protein [Dawidia cretensis]MBT1711941.1 SusC/RagA family TonB-linked outer membrane protein [Dawidia cretensis]
MKQNFTYKGLARLYFIMRVSLVNLILLVTPCLQVLNASPANGQNVHDTFVSINVEHVPLKKVFKIIEDQTGLLFVYPPDLVEVYNDVSVNDSHISVYEVLESTLTNLPIAFKESDNNIYFFWKSSVDKDNSVVDGKFPQTITGKVIEMSSGTGLPGVSIVIKGTTNGTTTDAEGRYAIEARADDILVFSSVGFKNQEILVGGRSVVDIQMEEDVASLNEVVINGGYYTTTSEAKTGSIVKISEKEIRDQPVTSPLLSLQGRAAGVDISPNSGVPGGGINIKIRGQGSIRLDGGYPLYVIDGVPVDSSPLESASSVIIGKYDPLSTLNPANIQSIEVLKDADATAIYGSRGANGVVLITTKKASGERTSADFNIYRGVGQLSKKMKMLNTQQYLDLRREAFRNNDNEIISEFNAPDLLVWDTTRFTDWQDVLIGGTSNITDLQGGISGGTSNTSFRLGGGYHKETTIFPGDFYFERLTGNLSINHRSKDGKFNATVSSNYGVSNNYFFESPSAAIDALSLPPNAPNLYNEGSGLNWELASFGTSTWNNPLAEYRKTNDAESASLIFNSTLSYNLWKGVIVKTNLGYNNLVSSEIIKIPLSSYNPDWAMYNTPESTFGDGLRRSWIVEPQILFSRMIKFHGIDAVLGSTFQEGSNRYKQITGTGYASDALLGSLQGAASNRIVVDDNSQYRYTALFARIGYNWKEKYFLSVTGRRDGSSRFGPENRFGNFGSLGAAWIFSKEDVFDRLPFVSFGKVRASLGITGNDQIGDYRYLDTYKVTPGKYHGTVGLYPTSLYNPEYKWEVNKKIEAAIELGLIKDRLFIEVAWYNNRSSNQLTNYQLPGTTGLGAVFRNLDATVENTGWELTSNAHLFNRSNFKWDVSFNISLPNNKLIEFFDLDRSSYANTYVVGEPVTIQRFYKYTGVDPGTGVYTFLDVDSNGVLNGDDKIVTKDFSPKYFGGITNTISYGSFEMSFLFQFVKKVAMSYLPANVPGQAVNVPVDFYNSRWRQIGDITDVEKLSTGFDLFSSFNNNYSSNNSIQDASFFRLKTLSMSYSVPGSLLDRAKIKQLRVYFHGQNIFTATDFFGLDPETGTTVIPALRMMSLGVQIGI